MHFFSIHIHTQTHVAEQCIDKSELDRVKRDLEEKYRGDLQSRLGQLNDYLKTQAHQRNETELRSAESETMMKLDFEKTKQQLVVSCRFIYRSKKFER